MTVSSLYNTDRVDNNIRLNEILSLNDNSLRVRYSKMNLIERIIFAVRNFFSGGSLFKETDIKEFDTYAKLISNEVASLNTKKRIFTALGRVPVTDHIFFKRIKRLLHVQAKIEFTSWAKSLADNPEYKKFTNDLKALKDFAQTHVAAWAAAGSNTEKNRRHQIRRWIEADDIQLKFAGYANEIIYKAEEIPVGAVLLANAQGMQMRNRILGYSSSWAWQLTLFKSYFCTLFTGSPATHAMASLGGGRFIHIAKANEATGEQIGMCSGRPVIEDYSHEARQKAGKKGSKYMFGYEILVPDYERFGKAIFGRSSNRSQQDVEKYLNDEWKKDIESINRKVETSLWGVISTIFSSRRPENYEIEKVFKSTPETGYSCSGLISASLAKHGIDIVKKSKKRIDKAAPTDFVRTDFYRILFSNNRRAFRALREPS